MTDSKPALHPNEIVFVPFGPNPLRGLHLTAATRERLERQVAKGVPLVTAMRQAIERGLRVKRRRS